MMSGDGGTTIRDLGSLDDCRRVVSLQQTVWGVDGETVPASVLLVSAKRGGILLGAFAGSAPGETDDPAGFVWSMPGTRDDGQRTHWSHMLGVRPEARGRGLGEQLKWAQRERALSQGVDLVEWTFDPLQAANAHFNLHVLGAVGVTYGIDVYGAMSGPLHRGTPTDRIFVEWWISEPHVARRHAARRRAGTALAARSAEILLAPQVLRLVDKGVWPRPAEVEPMPAERRVLVPIPPGFSDMQRDAAEVAVEWRLAVRGVLTDAFARGYRAVDFFLDRDRGGGRYLLARPDER